MSDIKLPDGKSFKEQTAREALMYALSHISNFDKCLVILAKVDDKNDSVRFLYGGGNVNYIESLGMLAEFEEKISGDNR